MKRRSTAALLVAALIIFGALALGACRDDDKSSGRSTKGNPMDRAFAADMIPHHESAVAMAKLAKENGSREQIRMLADDIVAAQAAEITQLRSSDQRLAGAGVKVGDLGVSDDAMGMAMKMDELDSKQGFDRTFIDMMVPHHQGAIRMARIELAKGSDPELKALAAAIVTAQSKEIAQMNGWRLKWYGATSPAGGVPAEGEGSSSSTSMDGMGHG